MEKITLKDLVLAVNGELLGDYRDLTAVITGVQSDNRKIEDGNVFFAYIGEKTDGHKYVKAALEAGAAGAVVSKEPEEYVPGKFYCLVKDTLLAVGDLARWYRSQFDIPVVGITGSVGKTTTKDMIASVLSEKYRVVKTEANFNNNIGLPRTIFRIDHTTELAVLEMGMNHLGEIDYLVHIAQPTAVTITNVGEAHIGILGSKDNIYKAKTEIFGGLKDGGFAVMNGDDEYLARLRTDEEKQKKFTFAWAGEGESCDYRAVEIEDTLAESVRFRAMTPEGSFDVTVPALGHHMIYPAMTAAALGAYFGLTKEEIAAGIASYTPTRMRMERITPGHGVTIYNDAYNANPQSMKAGLQTLSNQKDVKRVAILGDMFELGAEEERLHREVGKYAGTLPIDTLVTIGRASRFIAEEALKGGLTDVRACEDKVEAKEVLSGLIAPDTCYYIKASHGMALEELVPWLDERIKAM